MDGPEATPAPRCPAWPADGLVDGLGEFRQVLRGLLGNAATQGVRHMVWSAPSMLSWPFEEPELLEALTQWVRQPAAHLTWLSVDFEPLRQRHPRLTRWRQTWAHKLRCLQPHEEMCAHLPTLVWTEAVVLQLQPGMRPVGRVSGLRDDIAQARALLDAVSQRSTDTFPVTVLGL